MSAARVGNFIYLGGLHRHDECQLSDNPRVIGSCQLATDCIDEFEKFKNGSKELRVCGFESAAPQDTVICCPATHRAAAPKNRKYSLDFLSCRDRYLAHREKGVSLSGLIRASIYERRKLTEEDCKNINTYNKATPHAKNPFYYCSKNSNGYNLVTIQPTYRGHLGKSENWQNMAALGWTQFANEIKYYCGGVIIHERFILTAAHCGKFKAKSPDTVRLGDRFLLDPTDDAHAQQIGIEKFVPHPGYKSSENYNDIALVKTKRTIQFNQHVSPACVSSETDHRDLALVDYSQEKAVITTTTASYESNNKQHSQIGQVYTGGYGETEEQNGPSNILHEIYVTVISNEHCNETFQNFPKMPRGIFESQICIQGRKTYSGVAPDTCFGDSGGPVQYRAEYEVENIDYEKTLLKTVYYTPVLIGLVSFGIGCGFDVPSVNTRVSYYRDWIETAMTEHS